jgi:CelD/BcsL family acetyltransferase involved in cellulose biosynthesis
MPELSEVSASLKCEVEVLRDPARLEDVEAGWKSLFEVSPTASPPLRWEWVREWWRVFGPVYGDKGRGLRILALWRDSRLVGVLPLYLRRKARRPFQARRLGFLTTGLDEFEETCAEYLDLLHAPGEEGHCVEALRAALLHAPLLRCDELVLSDLPAGSPLLALAESFQRGVRRVSATSSGHCHLFDLRGGFEAYLDRLSHENRRQARKMLREVEREGMKFEVARDGDHIRTFFGQMVQLHRQRWTAAGKPGSFAPRHAEFHGTLAELLVPRGEAVIARLSLGGNPFAVVFGYRVGETLHCYQQGVTQGIGRVRSPGTAAWLLLMRNLADDGVTLFDHQRGRSVFKDRFGTGARPLAELCVAWPSPRLLVSRAAEWTRRAANKAIRLFRRPVTAPTPPESS